MWGSRCQKSLFSYRDRPESVLRGGGGGKLESSRKGKGLTLQQVSERVWAAAGEGRVWALRKNGLPEELMGLYEGKRVFSREVLRLKGREKKEHC